MLLPIPYRCWSPGSSEEVTMAQLDTTSTTTSFYMYDYLIKQDIPTVVLDLELEKIEDRGCLNTLDQESRNLDNESIESGVTTSMIPLSVSVQVVENRFITENEHNNNTEYNSYDVFLHDDEVSPQESTVVANYYTYEQPILLCRDSTKSSVESIASHNECSDTILPQTYFVHNTKIDQFKSFIITKRQISGCLIQNCFCNDQILFIRTQLKICLANLKRVLEDIVDLLVKYMQGKGRGPFTFKLRKRRGSGYSLHTCSAGIDNREIIRFLLWINPLTTHFREIKVTPSVVFDGKGGSDNQARVCFYEKQNGTTSININEGSRGFLSRFLVSCLSLVAFIHQGKKRISSDPEVGSPEMKSLSKVKLQGKFNEKCITPVAIVELLAAVATAFLLSSMYIKWIIQMKNKLTDSVISKVGLLGIKRSELKNLLCNKGSNMLKKAMCTVPLNDDMKILFKLGSSGQWANPKKDFLRDVLNIPDCMQPPQQILEVYPVFEQRGYEDEFTRLASFGTCPVDNWPPAVTLAENGFYYDPKSSVICNFCKSKSHTWQNDWDPKRKHEPNCSFPNGNIPIEPSRENGKYQPAVELALAELQLPDLHNKVQVLQRNATRSVESFKNPQLPEMGSLSIDVNQSRGQQEHDAMEEEPRPSTSNSTATRQQQEGAGGLRYFVHSYDERGRPISTSQKMEFNSKEEKANTSMKKETDRLKSFANVWKKGDVISPEELAKSGFYYAGTGDRVRCAFCNGVLRNWAVGDHAAAEHRRHYPTCPFVLNLDVGNVPYSPDLSGLHTSTAATTNHAVEKKPAARAPAQQSAQSSVPSFGAAITPSAVPGTILIPKHSNFSTVESRMLTYDNWPTSNVQRPKQLAEAGFFYTGASDNVRCFHCDGGLRNWLDSDMPWVEHAKWFPRCGFLQRAKGVEFVLEETRKHNQQNFTTAVAQNRGSTGMTTTPAPTQGVGIVERPSTGGVRRVEAREVRARFDTDRVKMVLDMGYKEAVVKYVILQRLRYTGDDFPSTQEMLESVLAEEQNLEEKGIGYYENILQQEFGRPMTIVYPQVPQMTGPAGTLDKTAVPSPAPPMTQTTSASLQIPGDEKSLVEENRQLKEQTTCKICMDNEVSMVFVPCGHLVACADCAPNLRQCPICRRAITGTIRTFLS